MGRFMIRRSSEHKIMNRLLSLILLVLHLHVEDSKAQPQLITKAASGRVNCGCQCSNLSFLDELGASHGNCKRADETGALWCYVDPYYSDCEDLGVSLRFQNTLWSYQACDTPTLNSLQCLGRGPSNSGVVVKAGWDNETTVDGSKINFV